MQEYKGLFYRVHLYGTILGLKLGIFAGTTILLKLLYIVEYLHNIRVNSVTTMWPLCRDSSNTAIIWNIYNVFQGHCFG